MCHMCSCVKSLSWIFLTARPVVNYAIASIHFCARLFELHSTENPLIETTTSEDLFEQTCLRVPQLWLKLVIWATKHQARVLWNFCGKSSVLKFLYAQACRSFGYTSPHFAFAYRNSSVRNSALSGRPVGDKKINLKLNFLLS